MSRSARLAIAIALAAAGCAESNSATVVEVPPPPTTTADLPPPVTTAVAAPQPAAPGLLGDWHGTYECAQGATDLDLHVTRAGQNVTAVFEFSHAPSGAQGSYELRGRLGESGDVVLVPSRWIQQPPGYVMVGMRGTVSGDSFRGRIAHPTCGGFDLVRVR